MLKGRTNNDPADRWYWSKRGQVGIEEALEDLKAGRVKEFTDVKELIRELNE